ncbi:MAG: TRAP transporter large permease subunit [Deltaproteobacteria bacterium]|nr:TRAP transporter large permease subunit [Deltaproteobacteria bacterium]
MYKLLLGVFDGLEKVISTVDRGVRGALRSLWDGPIQSLLFGLILALTGAWVLLRGIALGVDRLLARIEQALIVVAMLAMTFLSFMNYLSRELPKIAPSIDGAANMSVALMVWVGFLGASLATREGGHLSVDAADKLLSPRAARLSKRFAALLAAAFCWNFTTYAVELVDEALVSAAGQEGLPLWDLLVAPINFVGAVVHGDLVPASAVIALGCGLALACVAVLAQLHLGGARPAQATRLSLEAVGAAGLALGGLGLAAAVWDAQNLDGTPFVWTPLQTMAEQVASKQASFEQLKGLIGDTGTPPGGKAPDIAALVASSAGGTLFPLWVTQSILPLSFFIMAARFLGRAIFADFAPPADAEPVKTQLVEDSGRGARDLLLVGLFPGLLLGIGAAFGLSPGWLLFLAAVLMMLVGAPLFLSIGTAAVGAVVLIQGISGYTVAKDMFESLKKEELLSLPFFVLAGNLMTQGSIAERLVGVARALMGRTPGGLGLASVMACVIFAAISGSSPVTVIAVGSIMFPMLVKERYPEPYSIGLLTSAGSLGIIIPPSVPMIIYAIMVSDATTQISPNDLFVAGVGPGLFIAAVLAVYTLYQTRPTRPGNQIIVPELQGGYLKNLGRELRKSALALLLPVLVLGGIYGVLGPLRFTVTEAAAVSVVYALIVELVFHRELKPKDLPRVLYQSGTMMGSLFLIIVLAIAFNKFLAAAYIPQQAAAWLQSVVTSKWQFLILVNVFLLLLGCAMEIISAILIVAPLLAPIAASYGIDPVHFGIIFIVNLELGYLTPPMGINLFVASTVFKRSIVQVIKASFPYMLLMLFCLGVVTAIPSLTLGLLGERPPVVAPKPPPIEEVVAPTEALPAAAPEGEGAPAAAPGEGAAPAAEEWVPPEEGAAGGDPKPMPEEWVPPEEAAPAPAGDPKPMPEEWVPPEE